MRLRPFCVWSSGCGRLITVFVAVMRFAGGLVVEHHEIVDVAPMRAAAVK